ncbi:MAG: ATPase [Paenibacillus sp. RIFOXYA1_FULL_44_5]|nr:MAG: ATPase [Paenibacillus sp. RIFOXYA1_FULL_44_5]
MFQLGEKVYIISDHLEQNLPVGDYAYIIAYDKNKDNVFDYVIRVPKMNKHFLVPASDIELEEELLRQEAERVEKEALLDYALASKNEALFLSIMNGDDVDSEQQEEVEGTEAISQEEFIKRVNLRAWI